MFFCFNGALVFFLCWLHSVFLSRAALIRLRCSGAAVITLWLLHNPLSVPPLSSQPLRRQHTPLYSHFLHAAFPSHHPSICPHRWLRNPSHPSSYLSSHPSVDLLDLLWKGFFFFFPEISANNISGVGPEMKDHGTLTDCLKMIFNTISFVSFKKASEKASKVENFSHLFKVKTSLTIDCQGRLNPIEWWVNFSNSHQQGKTNWLSRPDWFFCFAVLLRGTFGVMGRKIKQSTFNRECRKGVV